MPRALRFGYGTARCAASLDAALDVRAQGLSLLGRLRPIDLGLLWISRAPWRRRLACVLADHMSLVLGGSSEHVKCQPVRPGMSAMARSIKIRY